MTTFRKAQKRAVKLRAAIDGPTGAGKTLSALKIARGLVGPAGTIALIDTEHGTAEKFYAEEVDFDTVELTQYQPQHYIAMMRAAEGYDCLVIDSLSHAWEDGILAMVDAKGGQFNAWRDVTPHHKALVTALLTFPGHLIVTMRSKMAYEVTQGKGGKTTVEKLGLKPVQREGLEYEFDLVMDMSQNHALTVSKTRMKELADRTVIMPTEDFGKEIARLVSVGIADVAERSRELGRIAGTGRGQALREALIEAGIADRDALADDATFARAKEIAELVANPPAPDPEPEVDHEPTVQREQEIAEGKPHPSDVDDETRTVPAEAPEGQEALRV